MRTLKGHNPLTLIQLHLDRRKLGLEEFENTTSTNLGGMKGEGEKRREREGVEGVKKRMGP